MVLCARNSSWSGCIVCCCRAVAAGAIHPPDTAPKLRGVATAADSQTRKCATALYSAEASKQYGFRRPLNRRHRGSGQFPCQRPSISISGRKFQPIRNARSYPVPPGSRIRPYNRDTLALSVIILGKKKRLSFCDVRHKPRRLATHLRRCMKLICFRQ